MEGACKDVTEKMKSEDVLNMQQLKKTEVKNRYK